MKSAGGGESKAIALIYSEQFIDLQLCYKVLYDPFARKKFVQTHKNVFKVLNN